MSEKEFWAKQFEKRGIPKGSGKWEDYEACRRLIQSQSKLNGQIYDACLKIAADYCGV